MGLYAKSYLITYCVFILYKGGEVLPRLAEDIRFLDRAYPEIDIEFIVHHGEFSPALIQELSHAWNIPTNFMFIGSLSGGFDHNLADLGGVRLII